jgi:hypothetical protein
VSNPTQGLTKTGKSNERSIGESIDGSPGWIAHRPLTT